MANQKENTSVEKKSQWISSIVNVESKSSDNLSYLRSILGPMNEANRQKYVKLEPQTSLDLSNESAHQTSSGYFEHEIIFKIEDKVYIEEIFIYEKACSDSSIMKLEALKSNESSESTWFLMWETHKQLETNQKSRIFKPIITPTPFKTDTIRLSISGSLRLIDAIGNYI